MSSYDNNIVALEKRHKSIYDMLKQNEYSGDNVIIEQAKTGDNIVAYFFGEKKYYLNSKYNPRNEAEKSLAEEIEMPDESVLVMFGLSNGEFARYVLENNNKKIKIIVFEPSSSIFIEVIKNIDISDILSDERLILSVGGINDSLLPISLSKEFKNYNRETNRHVVVSRYGEIFVDELKAFQKTINERYDHLQIERNTMTGVGKRCVKNNILNLRYASGCRCSNDIVGLFPDDMPAIVVSSGPSLVKNIHLIKEAKGRAFILSTDSAYDMVIAQGVKPDMVASVDFAKPVKFFQGKNIGNVSFLADIDLNYEILELLNTKKLFFGISDSKVWTSIFGKVDKILENFDVGGSVATFAIANLVHWGFKKIILIGQDLAFTGGKIHARDDDDEKIEVDEYDYEYVECLDGNMWPVRKDYFQYLRWIEDLGYSNKDIEIIDATEGGSKKKNTTIMTFREAIDTYCKNSLDIEKELMKLPVLFEGEDINYIKDYLAQTITNLRKMRDRLTNSYDYCRKGERILSSGKYDVNQLRKINAYIAETDKKFVESEEIIMINKYVAEAELDLGEDMYIEEEDPIKESIRMYNKSGLYYNKLAGAIPEIIKLIEGVLAELK